jgi:hypothetical protein
MPGSNPGANAGHRHIEGPWLRFNFFQRMMLRWRELHAYNPVHVVRVPVALEPERLRRGIAEQLEALGLTGLHVDRARWRYRYAGGPAEVELAVLAGGDDPLAVLSRAIESEINRPFAPSPHEDPFRFFAVEERGAFRLAVVYDHYVAGGDSIARVLTGLACDCARFGAAPVSVPAPAPMATATATASPAENYRSMLLSHPGWVVRCLIDLPRVIASARRACRVPYVRVEDAGNEYTYLHVDTARTRRLRGLAKDWGVTMNDLLMACLLRALSPLAQRRHSEPRRNQLAVASILNMRRDFRPEMGDAMNPFLGAFRVSHTVPDGIGLRQLACDVQLQTARIKRHHLYLQSLMALGLSALLWPLLTPLQRHGFYAKHFAVWAGISTLDLNPIWERAAREGTARLDYLRAVPTGPLCPLVLAVTIAHDELHLAFTWRTSAFSREDIAAVAADLLRDVDSSKAGTLP